MIIDWANTLLEINKYTGLIAIGIASVGIWRYLDSRKRELDWKRKEFLFKQAELLDSDPDIRSAINILEERLVESDTGLPHYTAKEIFEDLNGHSGLIIKFDKLLNLFDRLAYSVYDTHTLRFDDIANFSWYYKEILKYPAMVDYCNKNGFEDVVKLANQLSNKQDGEGKEEEMSQKKRDDFKEKANSFSNWFTTVVIANFVYLQSFSARDDLLNVQGKMVDWWVFSFWFTVISLTGIFIFKALGVLAAYFRTDGDLSSCSATSPPSW